MTPETTERDLVELVEELLARYPREGLSFPKPSQSRMRDVLNDYACGCQVRRDGAGAHLIHACATHNAAPELLRRLVEEVKRLRECHATKGTHAIECAIEQKRRGEWDKKQ